VALANYKITLHAPEEGEEPTQMLTRHSVIARFAPGFDLADALDAEDAEKWLDAFAVDKLAQKAQQIEIEVLDVKGLAAEAEAELEAKQDELAAIQARIGEIAVARLRLITQDEVKAGEIHPAKPGSKKLVNIVEQQRLKIGKPASKVLEENPNLPEPARKVLEKKAEEDREATRVRMEGGKNSK
jgi:hypothetical protein